MQVRPPTPSVSWAVVMLLAVWPIHGTAASAAAQASTPGPAALTVARDGHADQRLHVTPDAPLELRVIAGGAWVDLTIAFEGAEVQATLTPASGDPIVARAPERSRGTLYLSTASTPSSSLTLRVQIVHEYAHDADVVLRWASPNEISPRDRERAALWREVYGGIADWRKGIVAESQRAITRLTACLDRIRAADTPALLLEALLTLGEVNADLNNREPALAALTEAEALAKTTGATNEQGLALIKLGEVRGSTGEPKSEEQLAGQALPLRHAAGDVRGEAYATMLIAGDRVQGGAIDEGLAQFENARTLAIASGDRRLQAQILNNHATALSQSGKPQAALEMHQRALPLRRLAGDKLGEGQTLSNMGATLGDLGETRRAIELLDQALAIRRAAGHRQGEGNTLYNLGMNYLTLTEYQHAIDRLSASLAIWRETRGVRGEAFTRQSLGLAYSRIGDLARARAFYAEALPLWEHANDPRGQAICLNYLAQQAIRDGALDEAAAHGERALALTRKGRSRREEADVLITLGSLASRRGDLAAAQARYREALTVAEAINNGIGIALAHLELGQALDKMGQSAEGRAEIITSLKVAEDVENRRLQVAALAALARVDRASGALADADTEAHRALDLIEQLRVGVESLRARTYMGVSAQTVYELARDIAIDRHQREPSAGHDREAFAIHERARARSLLEGLADPRPPFASHNQAAVALAQKARALEADLEAKTARLGRLLETKRPAMEVNAARAELAQLVSAVDETRADLRRQSPAYAALTQPTPLTIDALQKLLGTDTALIEIALGETRSVGWLVSITGVRTVALPARAAIEDAARTLVDQLTVRNQFPNGESRAARQTRIATADAEWTRPATQLTGLVLAPFGPFHARRVALVVDGALARVPFVVLPVTSQDGRLDPSKPCAPATCALGRSVEVVTLPSASVLAELRRGRATRAPRTLRAAVLADPVFRADDPRVSHLANGSETTTASTPSADEAIDIREGGLLSPDTLTRLPYSRAEASAIASLAGKDVFIGLDFDASRATIDAGKLGRPDVLHIATHAMVDEAQPELSGIVLSLVDKQGARVRGFLPLVEVYDLPVSANLIVLSACRTAAGPDVRGEGLVSLTRGFMYAGTPRVIASLWSIEDEATAAFMRSFYEALFTKHLPPSAALAAAQQTMQRTQKWASPYYWAAFAFHGDWE